ncbi:MAG: exodeoxyribonuclease III [Acidimicrobiales bacterium]
MRIATWNVNSLNARLPRVEEWLQIMEPDILCMQETKMADDAFPGAVFEGLGYESVHHGEGRWNGVAILSRVGLNDPVAGFSDGGDPDPDARIVWATCGGIRVASAYIPNGRSPDHEHYQYKLEWLGRLGADLGQNTAPSDEVAVLGDFNIAPEDIDVWDIGAFEGATHVTKPERDAFFALCDWGLVDLVRAEYPDQEGLFTYYDYTAGRFHKREGMRIDFVLATEPVAGATQFVLIDRNARKGEKPSDHVPLMADVDL